uniref:Claudin n=1 Tax=Cyclopterus lumpus TaxID=8103 RepID=A0A8C2XKC3_CYCLU
MNKRLIQVLGFLTSSLGWLFVLCTMAMDYWRISQLGGQGGSYIIKVAWYWSNLWKDCFTDSTAVTNCRDFPVLWTVTPFVQAVRGLLMCGLTLGFFAVVLCFLGMECTYIGGAQKTKDKMLFAGAVFHIAGSEYTTYTFVSINDRNVLPSLFLYFNNASACSMYNCSLLFVSHLTNSRYDLGPPIFLGLVGCFLILLGGMFFGVTVFRVIVPERY